MSKLPREFIEDKALRDSARDVLMADIDHARGTFSAKGVATKVGGRIGDGAKDVFEVAKVNANGNRGTLAVIIGAVVLFFARGPIMEILGLSQADEETFETDDDSSAEGSEAAPPHSGDDNEQ